MPCRRHHFVICFRYISNMKLVIFTALLGMAVADRLDNTYLPPSSARTAGGSGNFLAAPRSSFGHGSSLDRSSFGSHGAGFGSGSSFGRSSFGGNSGFGHGGQQPAAAYGAPTQARFGGFGGAGGAGGYHGGQQIPILRLNNDNDGSGGYRYEYETGNGIQAQEAGQLKHAAGGEANDVHGSYSYTGDDGHQYTVHYTADENGFHPQGDHLPTPPPIPEAILRSLQYNAQNGGSGRYDDSGRYDGSSGLDGISVEAASRQYLAPRRSSFSSSNSGYRY